VRSFFFFAANPDVIVPMPPIPLNDISNGSMSSQDSHRFFSVFFFFLSRSRR